MAQAADLTPSVDIPVLNGTDHVELYVGNARQAAYHYERAFGFDVIAYAGPETGVRDRASYVLQQGKVRLVLTAGLDPDSEITRHVALHGDGVKAIAFGVQDAVAAFNTATGHGAKPVLEPTRVEDEHGVVTYASIATYGDTVHHFVERDEYGGVHWPGYRELSHRGQGVGLRFIDHTVGNVEVGRMESWVSFYSEVFGFNVFQEFAKGDIATQYSGMVSKVTRDPRSQVTLPINEPAVGLKKSQIQEYLDYYRGSGVQHIALHTDSIVDTVDAMKERGVEFLATPDAYYDAVTDRARGIEEDLDDLRRLNILVDRDDDGYLLQIFTRPVGDRPTLFFEVIQRKGCKGFGKGNFQALFEAIEREQEARGNL